MTTFVLGKPISFLKNHARRVVLGILTLYLVGVISACMFLLYGPTSDRDIIRIQEKQPPTVNLEQVNALLEKLDRRAPSLRSGSRNPFLDPEGLTATPSTQ